LEDVFLGDRAFLRLSRLGLSWLRARKTGNGSQAQRDEKQNVPGTLKIKAAWTVRESPASAASPLPQVHGRSNENEAVQRCGA
jgi:hypothetical protein